MNRGEVWWAEHPDAGRRPFLILTRQSAIPVLNSVMCAAVSRTIRGIPTEVLLDEDDGMPCECVVSFDNLVTVPKSLLVARVCRLRAERLVEVCPALTIAAGC